MNRTSKHSFLLLTGILLVVLLLSACAQAAPATQAAPAGGAGAGGGTASDVVVNQDSVGKTIDVKVGQKVLVKLGEDYDWKIDVTPTILFAPVADATLQKGEQGLYEVKMPGQITIQATGNPVCLKDSPPCTKPKVQFNIALKASNQ